MDIISCILCLYLMLLLLPPSDLISADTDNADNGNDEKHPKHNRFLTDSQQNFVSEQQRVACSTTCVDKYVNLTRQCCSTGNNKDCFLVPVDLLKPYVGSCLRQTTVLAPQTTTHKVPYTIPPTTIDGVWSSWLAWNSCDKTCGGGMKVRDRKCSFPAGVLPGQPCPGNYTHDFDSCNTEPCPVDGFWLDWSPWTSCSASCGGGVMFRTRVCEFMKDVPRGNNCTGSKSDSVSCNLTLCPVNGKWSPWSDFSACSVTCARGTQMRNRICIYDPVAPHGSQCFGNMTDSRDCNTTPCPGQTTVVAAQTTTHKLPYTIPPKTTNCAKCVGPEILCEKLYEVQPCENPNNYCINKIVNHNDGTRSVTRGCGNFDTCYKDWFLGSSDRAECYLFDENNFITLKFDCTFCCIKDGCNVPLRPTSDTMYKDL